MVGYTVVRLPIKVFEMVVLKIFPISQQHIDGLNSLILEKKTKKNLDNGCTQMFWFGSNLNWYSCCIYTCIFCVHSMWLKHVLQAHVLASSSQSSTICTLCFTHFWYPKRLTVIYLGRVLVIIPETMGRQVTCRHTWWWHVATITSNRIVLNHRMAVIQLQYTIDSLHLQHNLNMCM